MKILDGKKIASLKEVEIKNRVAGFARQPELAIVMVGEKPDSGAYVRQKIKLGERVDVKTRLFTFPENISEKKIIEEIKSLNENKYIDGIIVQLPLPVKFETRKIIDCIDPKKDVDGLTTINQGKLLTGDKKVFFPATAKGIISLLKGYKISLLGKKVAVVGRSFLVGRPTALLAEREGATIFQCHSKTKKLEEITKMADVLIVAVGRPKFIKTKHIKSNQIVLDVGITVIEKKGKRKLVGDVDFSNVSKKVKAISPVPGGIGPMTVVSLFENVCEAYESNLNPKN